MQRRDALPQITVPRSFRKNRAGQSAMRRLSGSLCCRDCFRMLDLLFQKMAHKIFEKDPPAFHSPGDVCPGKAAELPQHFIDQNKARWGRRGGLGEREHLPRKRRGSLSPNLSKPTAYFFLSMISRITLSASRMPEEPRRPRLAMQASISSSTIPSLPGTDLPSIASMAA